jgi:CRISPR/Cas system-associated protein Csm6
MKYPGTDQMNKIAKYDLKNPDDIIDLIVSCIDYIYDDETVYHSKEQSKKELVKFIEELPRSASDKLQQFFETIPKLKQTVQYKCKHCGTESSYDVEGIENFF